jgi:heptosyltransferase III
MSFFDKIINFKKTIKYHKSMVAYSYWFTFLKLYLIEFFYNKNIHIIILPEHIGDVIAFTPFAQRISQKDKKAYIAWIINPQYQSIINTNRYVNHCILVTCDGLTERFSKTKKFKKYDVRFNSNNYCKICDTKRIAQQIDNNFNLQNYYEYGSLLEIFSTFAKDPLKKEEWYPTIEIPAEINNSIKARNLPESYICIHTTSNDLDREWNLNKWGKLIEEITKKTNIKIIEIGLKSTISLQNDNCVDLCGKLNLIETAAVIKNANLFMGIDSGPAHIANALKQSSIILLGKYRNITNYMPFSGNFANGINSKIIYDSKLKCSEIDVETVLSAFDLLYRTK